MKESEKIAISILIGILLAIIIISYLYINDQNHNEELQKLHDKVYIDSYNKGFQDGAKKAADAAVDIMKSNNYEKKNISLEDQAFEIIKNLESVIQYESEAKENNLKIIYRILNVTKNYIEISVCQDLQDRIITGLTFKYYKNGNLFEYDVLNNCYKVINY